MGNLPKKLKHDSIVEAIFEIQFEHSDVGEVLVGRIAADAAWEGYQTQRLPLADFPAQIRDSEASFRYQPIFQLNRPEPGEVVKVGQRVISLHALPPYPGWQRFSGRLDAVVSSLLRATPTVRITRLGLRYINALTPLHGMSSIWDLNFGVTVAGGQAIEDVVTAFKFAVDDAHAAQVSIASPDYVQGSTVPDAVAFIDIDIFSPSPLGPMDARAITDWFHSAHDIEKQAFFSLWREEILTPLRED